MATTDTGVDGMTEECEQCGVDTMHSVSVQILTESPDGKNSHYSREPYRVKECQRCGERSSQRMNNA